jgi:hypothetical protein
VQAAAAKVREASYKLTDTYSLSLSVLFLDRLNVLTDTPLIESMLVRLLAGQNNGSWSYFCPSISEEEIRRLKAESEGKRELKTGRDLSKLPAKGKRKASDLPKEIQAQIASLAARKAGSEPPPPSDNSNTQFATIATWVGRRYGLPSQPALLAIDQYFRGQQNADGGWGYMAGPSSALAPSAMFVPGAGSRAAMTCAGLLGLAVGHGAALDIKKLKNPKLESSDVSKDQQIKRGLQALSTAVGKPTGWSGEGAPKVEIPKASGRAYYYLWSLERVCVAYNIETIDKKDWYHWGAEILLVSQHSDGSWRGEYAECGADTAFALLFLKRVNFAHDLSSGIKGAGSRLLKGGVGGAGLTDKPTKPLASTDIGSKPRTGGGRGGGGSKVPERPRAKPRTPTEAAAARLADDVQRASGERRSALLKKLRDTKGAEYTEALAGVISRLDVGGRHEARATLADRLTRFKDTTLREYLKDDDKEIRRAAAIAAAQRDSKSLVPDLIRLLNDSEALVERAAYAALKELSGKDFGPRSTGADRATRDKAIAAWQSWWKTKARE